MRRAYEFFLCVYECAGSSANLVYNLLKGIIHVMAQEHLADIVDDADDAASESVDELMAKIRTGYEAIARSIPSHAWLLTHSPFYGVRLDRQTEQNRIDNTIEVDALGSEKDEPGCLRFNVLQDAKDQNVYYFYEVYKDEAAL